MLHFVLGTTGVGKTEYLYDNVCKLAKNGDDRLMFIVPDQASFSTEKAFLELLGPKVSRNIKVFGFSRLCDYVFEQSGNRFMSFADEGIRNVVMNFAVEQVGDSLDLFSKRAKATDLSQLILNSVKEYKKCSITSQMLYDAADKVSDETLSKKLYETALLYDAYDALIEKSYIDPLDSLTHVCKMLSDKPLFDNYTIVVDSFYGFTYQEYELLEILLKQCKDMYVALTTDNTDSINGDLFFVSDRTKKRLSSIAKNNDIPIATPVTLYENTRFNNSELKAIEENIFRLQKERENYSGDSLKIYEAKNIYDEAEFVARSIKKLVIENNYEFSDIAVITRQSDKYLGILDTMLQKYGINYFMDKPQDIDTKPLIKFIMACFDVVTGGFDKDDVLALLKTGLTDVTVEQIADFENYIFIWDINGKQFFDEFTLNPRGFAENFTEADIKLLSQVENTRKTIIDNLKTFYFDSKDTTASEISKALMKLIYRLNCKENLNKLCDSLEKNNELSLCAEQIRLYNIFIEILDKMVKVFGDYSISAKRFSELLHINFVNTDISFIPHGIDQVDVACADRSLIEDKKAVFVIGAVEGEFPHTPVESGVYSDDERNVLSDLGITLSDSVAQLVPTEKFLAYKALTSATDKLYVSYSTFSLSGEKLAPSAIVSELTDIFDNIRLYTSVDYTMEDNLWCEQSAFEYFVKHYDKSNADIKKLREYFSSRDGYKDIIASIENSKAKTKKRITDPELAKKIFNPKMELSASQIDNFQQCKFRYFCNYGLRIRERRQAVIGSLEYGTLIHYVMEQFFKNHCTDDFSTITEEAVTCEVAQLLDYYVEHFLGGTENKSSRFMYLYNRMKRTATSIVYRVVQEFAQSKFRPVEFEFSIGDDIDYYTLQLNDEISVKIKGSIDRVDIMENNGKKYIRVVDYKTGSKTFKLSDVLYGINLQMLIYMSALNRNGKSYFGDDITPAGVLYMPAIAPAANVTQSDPLKKAKAKAESKRKMFGFILDDIDVVKGMEENVAGEYIPVTLKNDVLVDSTDSLATLEQFGALFSQVDKTVTEMAKSLCDGDVAAIPLKGDHEPCSWCVYNCACGYEDGDECIEVSKFDKETVYSVLMGEGEQNNDELD
ncbi:MAG: PD-(D/E)XK nuclease family protein [Eubacteriales bacterium]|nr:PD-(D/E)XK nuclease family protein [Eubacteriales bacterium]